MSGTWGAPNLPTGLDQFTARQLPDVRPVDDLSRFVLDRIREAETEPRADQIPQNHNGPGAWPIAYRYAGYVRADMVAFRVIVEQYLVAKHNVLTCGGEPWENQLLHQGRYATAEQAMLAVANRWSQHHDFRDEWRLE